jgi:hypothetical protein
MSKYQQSALDNMANCKQSALDNIANEFASERSQAIGMVPISNVTASNHNQANIQRVLNKYGIANDDPEVTATQRVRTELLRSKQPSCSTVHVPIRSDVNASSSAPVPVPTPVNTLPYVGVSIDDYSRVCAELTALKARFILFEAANVEGKIERDQLTDDLNQTSAQLIQAQEGLNATSERHQDIHAATQSECETQTLRAENASAMAEKLQVEVNQLRVEMSQLTLFTAGIQQEKTRLERRLADNKVNIPSESYDNLTIAYNQIVADNIRLKDRLAQQGDDLDSMTAQFINGLDETNALYEKVELHDQIIRGYKNVEVDLIKEIDQKNEEFLSLSNTHLLQRVKFEREHHALQGLYDDLLSSYDIMKRDLQVHKKDKRTRNALINELKDRNTKLQAELSAGNGIMDRRISAKLVELDNQVDMQQAKMNAMGKQLVQTTNCADSAAVQVQSLLKKQGELIAERDAANHKAKNSFTAMENLIRNMAHDDTKRT